MQPVVTNFKGRTDGFVMEQGITQLRHARQESRIASKPELNGSAARERKVRARQASSATWAVVLYMRRWEPPGLRIAGAEWSAARTRAQRSEKESHWGKG
jgi:type II secretory pathway component PulM